MFIRSRLLGPSSDADFVIQAAPERIDLKLQLFAGIEQHAPPETIVTSNTSALSITEMAATLRDPGRVADALLQPCPQNEAHRDRAGARDGSRHAGSRTGGGREDGEGDGAGQGIPRVHHHACERQSRQRGLYMLMEGVASPRDIDKALKLGLNHPMGPFELVDLVGLDTRLSILEYLQRTMGEKYRPCPLLVQYVKAGRLGKNVGPGVYEY